MFTSQMFHEDLLLNGKMCFIKNIPKIIILDLFIYYQVYAYVGVLVTFDDNDVNY